MIRWFLNLFSRKPVRMAIVRRYADANGNYVGELYIERERRGVKSFEMVGASLDSMPLLPIPTANDHGLRVGDAFDLDTRHDFLAPMPRHVLRVGALDPLENDKVRSMVAGLPRKNMRVVVQNRFIEHVMEKKT
jgi:hypothetical protein